MKPYEDMKHFELSEKVVNVLMAKTQNSNPLFFRVMFAYYLAKIASMMRCDIVTKDRGIVPINIYAIALASSGAGKGYSTKIVEDNVIDRFRKRFLEQTFPEVA